MKKQNRYLRFFTLPFEEKVKFGIRHMFVDSQTFKWSFTNSISVPQNDQRAAISQLTEIVSYEKKNTKNDQKKSKNKIVFIIYEFFPAMHDGIQCTKWRRKIRFAYKVLLSRTLRVSWFCFKHGYINNAWQACISKDMTTFTNTSSHTAFVRAQNEKMEQINLIFSAHTHCENQHTKCVDKKGVSCMHCHK